MVFICAEATADDFPALVEVQFNTFLHPFQYEPYHEVLYPGGNTAKARAAAVARILKEFHEDRSATFLKVTDSETGRIIAGGKWAVCENKPDPDPKPFSADWVVGDDDYKAYTEHVITVLYTNRAKYADGKPYVVLDMLYTDLAFQGRGAGQLIMNWGVQKAQELGWQSVIESTRFGKGLYEKNGYTADHLFIDVPEKWLFRPRIHYWFMYKPAPAAAAATNGIANGSGTAAAECVR